MFSAFIRDINMPKLIRCCNSNAKSKSHSNKKKKIFKQPNYVPQQTKKNLSEISLKIAIERKIRA